MQETLITMDAALSARLLTCRQLFLRLDAGTAESLSVRLPEGGSAAPGMRPGEGLRASGALLAYALLGREDADAEALMDRLSQEATDRQLRRLCQMAAEMLRDSAAFSQASLYAALRTALVFLPESQAAAELLGLQRQEDHPEKPQAAQAITARYAWAEDAAIAYFDLPEGVSEATVGDRPCTAEMCRRGVCLPPDAESVPVSWPGGSAVLTPHDPLGGMTLTAGFRAGPFFIEARRVPPYLWPRLTPWIRVRGPAGGRTPDMTIVTSSGESRETAGSLPQGVCYLRCPRLTPQKDAWVEIRVPGVRYLDLTGEG